MTDDTTIDGTSCDDSQCLSDVGTPGLTKHQDSSETGEYLKQLPQYSPREPQELTRHEKIPVSMASYLGRGSSRKSNSDGGHSSGPDEALVLKANKENVKLKRIASRITERFREARDGASASLAQDLRGSSRSISGDENK